MFIIEDNTSEVYFRVYKNGFDYWTKHISKAQAFSSYDEAEKFRTKYLARFTNARVVTLS